MSDAATLLGEIAAGGGAGTCQNKTNQPGGKE